MFRELRGLARESAVYGLSTVLGRLLSFLLVPLFTHLLDRAQSGVVQTVYAYVAFLAVLYGLGLDVAYLRLGRRDGGPDGAAFGGALACVGAAALAVSTGLYACAGSAARLIGIPSEFADVVRCAAGILALDALALVPYAELRGAHRAPAYAGVKLAGLTLNLVLAWIFVRGLGLGVRGVFLANLAASAAGLALLAPLTAARVSRPDLRRVRELLLFGLPLALAGLGSMIVQVADRPLLARLAGLPAAGLYGNCYKLGVLMMLVVGMFDQAWKPFVLERASRPDVDRLIARVLTYFAAIAAWTFLAIAHFVEPAVTAPIFAGRPLFHPAYWDGLRVVPVVTLGYLFNGFYFVMLAPLLIERRTASVGLATWAGAALNVGANFLLIPRWGIMGAAWATLLAYAGMAAAVWALGRRPVPYEGRRLLLLGAWTAALWIAGARLGLGARTALLAAYPLGLRLFGFFDSEELAELKALLRFRDARDARTEPPLPAAD
ncbi:MAG: lipopolysaccharide biosynthesis protein [Elusimicrobia bacterium]|nr:lipopolysaccharide biosynthesis protein [Elusimicrobiota bacterium]